MDSSVLNVRCPALNSVDSPSNDILIKLDSDLNPIEIICPDYEGNKCISREKGCLYKAGWQKL